MSHGRQDPWTVLGLARGERDRAKVRRAYAQQLRAHPPEDDPVGFRDVRDAYELLLGGSPAFLGWLARGLEPRADDDMEDEDVEAERREDDLEATRRAAPPLPRRGGDPDTSGMPPAVGSWRASDEVRSASTQRPVPAQGEKLTLELAQGLDSAPPSPAGPTLPPAAEPLRLAEPSASAYVVHLLPERLESPPVIAPPPPAGPTLPPAAEPLRPAEPSASAYVARPPPERPAGPPVLAPLVPPGEHFIPPAWHELLDRALASHAPGRSPDRDLVSAALVPIGREALTRADGGARLAGLVCAQRPADHSLTIAEAFPRKLAFLLLAQGESEAVSWVLERLIAAGQVEALARLAVVLAEQPEQIHAPGAQALAMDIAMTAAALVPKAARAIIDAVWREASPALRRTLPMDEAEHLTALGRELGSRAMAGVPRNLVALALLPVEVAPALSAKDQEALKKVLAAPGMSDLVRDRVAAMHPEFVLPKRRAPVARIQHNASGGSKGNARSWVWGALIVLVSLGHLVRACAPTRSDDRLGTGGSRLQEMLRDMRRSTRVPIVRYTEPLSPSEKALLEDLTTRKELGPLEPAEEVELVNLRLRASMNRLWEGSRTLSERERRDLVSLRRRRDNGEVLDRWEQDELDELTRRDHAHPAGPPAMAR